MSTTPTTPDNSNGRQQSQDNVRAGPGAAATSAFNTDETDNTDDRITESYLTVFTNISHSLASSLKWCPTSEQELAKAERDLLAFLERPFKAFFVDIGSGWGLESNKIRTLEMLEERKPKAIVVSTKNNEVEHTDHEAGSTRKKKKRVPIVMVHGFAAGIGTWILNLDALSATLNRKIYAIDLLGFARSSRGSFDLSGDVEGQFIDSIERWRNKMGLDKVILLGHSFGGYLCGSYALKHPNRVSHVILADPWGIQDRQAAPDRGTYRFPIWVRVVNSIFQSFNPLAVLRASGPYGPTLVHKFRGDLREKFRPKLQDECDKFLNYIYHCNAQRATGESAFKALALPYGWPKNPLVHRLINLDPSVSLTFIYGGRSWIETAPGEFLRDCMEPNRVNVHTIEASGHHVYADRFTEFNELVRAACANIKE